MFSILALRGLLSGAKTYIVAGIYLACLIAEGLLGLDIPNFDAGSDWLETAFAMLLVITGRSAAGKLSIRDVTKNILK
jgi:hypothetical protein